jgi:crossover junction endodeoxyribonuclease RusA
MSSRLTGLAWNAPALDAAKDGHAQGNQRNIEEGGMIITLPWPTRGLAPNLTGHYMVKAKLRKSYREACAWTAKEQGVKQDWPESGKISVHLTFFPPNRIRRDHDNLIASMKSGLDGLANAMGVNDHRFVISSEVSDDIGGMVKITVKNKGE